MRLRDESELNAAWRDGQRSGFAEASRIYNLRVRALELAQAMAPDNPEGLVADARIIETYLKDEVG